MVTLLPSLLQLSHVHPLSLLPHTPSSYLTLLPACPPYCISAISLLFLTVNNFQSISFTVKQQLENEEEYIEMARKMEELDHEINKQENKLQNAR